MRVQKVESRVRDFCNALDLDEQWRWASGLFFALGLATSASNVGRARTGWWIGAGSDKQRVDSRTWYGRVGEVRLQELCFDVLDELVKVPVWVEVELGSDPV